MVYQFDITMVERTAILLVMLMGIGVVVLCIAGIVIQIIFHYKFSHNLRIFLSKNYWRQIVLIVAYAICIICLYNTRIDGGYIILTVAILPLTFQRLCLKCNQYFILFEHKLLYLGKDFILYQVENINLDKENSAYVLYMTSEDGTMEKLVIPLSKVVNKEKKKDLEKWLKDGFLAIL
jgi:amino acid transporter